MHAPTSTASRIRPLLLTVLLPLSALAAPPAAAGELRESLAEARAEVRREMATARAELRDENLELGQSLRFRSNGKRSADDEGTGPRGEITPDGDLLIDGEPVAVDARQRAQLRAYRNQVIEVALAGMEVGEKAAEVALESVDRSVIGLVFSAMTGRLERQLEQTIRTTLEPGILQLCRSLPPLLESQQALAASVPEFQPYATLERDEVESCETDMRREFARI